MRTVSLSNMNPVQNADQEIILLGMMMDMRTALAVTTEKGHEENRKL